VKGVPLSRIRYDPFGGVEATQVWDGTWVDLDPTQPITQTDYLYQGDLLQRDLNLYITGDGRTYDPWLGKYLQPDPIGGPPLLPQAADRYQYAGNSPTGCNACWQRDEEFPLADILHVSKDIAFQVLDRQSIQIGIREFALLRITASRTALTTNRYIPRAVRDLYGFNIVGEGSAGRRVAESMELGGEQARLLNEWYLDYALPRGHGVGLGEAEVIVTRADPVYAELDSLPGWKWAGVGVDFVFGAGFQLMGDVGNPRLTPTQVGRRAGVAGAGVASFSYLGGLVGGAAASAVCGPGAPVCAVVIIVGGEFAGELIWQQWAQPWVFEHTGLGPAPLNLKPLTAQ
jgi:RHS repeat-associated protein